MRNLNSKRDGCRLTDDGLKEGETWIRTGRSWIRAEGGCSGFFHPLLSRIWGTDQKRHGRT